MSHGKNAILEPKTRQNGATPLHYAALNGHTMVVACLLAGGARSTPTHDGTTPAHLQLSTDIKQPLQHYYAKVLLKLEQTIELLPYTMLLSRDISSC